MNQISTLFKYLVMIGAMAMSFSSYSGTNHVTDTTAVVYGCMDSTSINYNPYATVSDGSCMADTSSGPVYGCMDMNSANYNPYATVSDGSCIPMDTNSTVYGCMDSTSINFNPYATVSDGSCMADTSSSAVYGCTNPNSFNYSPYATVNDGSCISVTDSTIVFGCTDPASLTFNPSANKNDGSCKYNSNVSNIAGCMDPLAYNYNSLATNSDYSCLYKQIIINTYVTIVKSELQDTVGSIVFDNCVINYSEPILNAYIENLTNIGNDSVRADWAIVQNDGIKTVTTTYRVQATGLQLFVLSISCSQSPNARITATAPKVNTFGDVAEVLTITGTSNKATATIGVALFPQPANNTVNYTVAESGTLSIFNLFGESVNTVEINSLNGEINLTGLAKGTYIYRFTGKSGQAVGKLIKQ